MKYLSMKQNKITNNLTRHNIRTSSKKKSRKINMAKEKYLKKRKKSMSKQKYALGMKITTFVRIKTIICLLVMMASLVFES
jgi:hypothetical protein